MTREAKNNIIRRMTWSGIMRCVEEALERVKPTNKFENFFLENAFEEIMRGMLLDESWNPVDKLVFHVGEITDSILQKPNKNVIWEGCEIYEEMINAFLRILKTEYYDEYTEIIDKYWRVGHRWH